MLDPEQEAAKAVEQKDAADAAKESQHQAIVRLAKGHYSYNFSRTVMQGDRPSGLIDLYRWFVEFTLFAPIKVVKGVRYCCDVRLRSPGSFPIFNIAFFLWMSPLLLLAGFLAAIGLLARGSLTTLWMLIVGTARMEPISQLDATVRRILNS